MKNILRSLLIILTITCSPMIGAQSLGLPADGKIYLDPELGHDQAEGTQNSPLQSLYEASERVNRSVGKGAITIFLAPGIYGLDKTVTFQPEKWPFTNEERLTIRAQILPDDANWNPGKMPVIVSTMPLNFKPNGNPDPLGGTSYGIQIETGHVTIQGLRVLGTPVHERPQEGIVRRNYPIVREGKDLEDLRVTQCLFIGDIHAIPNHLPVLASGQGVVVDHCVFYGVKDAVVFWYSDRPAQNCEMHHNLIVNIYGAAVWTWSVADDFKYYNNVVSNAEAFWILSKDKDSEKSFDISNSMVLGYNQFANDGGGPGGLGEPADPKRIRFGKDVVIQQEGKVELVHDLSSKYYLHLKPGSSGSELGAGLFYDHKN